MLALNLLSPEEKTEVKKIKTFFIIKNVSFIIISIVLIVGTIFTFMYLILDNSNESINDQIEAEKAIQEEEQVASIEGIINQLNLQLSRVQNIHVEYREWSNFLLPFSNMVPDGITLTNLRINNISSSVLIVGTAQDRDALLTFQTALNQFPQITNVTSPLSNLTQKESIRFEMTAVLAGISYE